MKKSTKTPSRAPDADFEIELARRRAVHCVHDAGRILTDAIHYAPQDKREAYTAIIGQLSIAEGQLGDLAPTGGQQ
jgi:hypothetical protein